MELRHLRYFKVAAEEEHFGRASERLHVTRPAVSHIIADLEQDLDVLLFERSAHRVRLTAAGRAFLPKVRMIIGDIDDAVAVVRRIGEGTHGELKIGYGSLTLLHETFRTAIKLFRENFPDVELSLVELPTGEQTKALAEGRIHAGFMHFGARAKLGGPRRHRPSSSQDGAVLDWVPIQKGKLCAIVPAGHHLAQSKSVRLPLLAGESFIDVPGGICSPGYASISTLFQKAGFVPRIAQEVSTIVAQLNLISVGMGIGLSVAATKFNYPPEVRVVNLSDVTYPTTFALAWIKGMRYPALDHMIQIVEQNSD